MTICVIAPAFEFATNILKRKTYYFIADANQHNHCVKLSLSSLMALKTKI